MGGLKYGMEYRPYYLAKEWVKMGHQVTLVGASFSHLRIQQPVVTTNKDFEEETVEGINYIWIKTPAYESTFARIQNIFVFVCKLWKYSRKISEFVKPDLVVASSTYPLDIYPARKIAKTAGAKLCYEVHDLWPLSPKLIGGYSSWHPFIIVMQLAENYAYKHVDKVISLLWNSEQHMREHGLAEGKFKCIPNGYCKEDWENLNLKEEIPQTHKLLFKQLENKIIVGFAGGFAASGSLDTLVKAAALLKEHDNLAFVFVGKGPEQEYLEKLVKERSLANTFFLPAVKKIQIPRIVAYFDVAFIGGIHSFLHKYGTSANKLTDYMLSAKPIIQAIDEPNSVIERVKCGICVEAENERLVADAILELTGMTREKREKMGEGGRKYALENLEWGILAKQFLDEFAK
ncbi:MAG: glycosyltransferase family 4 protein [Butyricimonas virosa]|uniref:glycosyltransferase family 4 protein n=1 Tax=Butyricimonas virosa TaxID=544645 RepID=UPI002432D13F|nr:glycosyltransferase family 4 protein [Butyricimonas virosa]MBS5625346.1 glycosyltransferase family 4 protein [Porphyromonadaceae bacterium]MCI7391287.1 glycosyltransferase family 4 protein [Butyricimonas virosa]MDY4903636.1 glycosyltransferase family 4 protein [Butyricimonas virosa]